MHFPSESNLLYETGTLSNDAWTDAGTVNLCKDLSIVNRRGHDSTDRKGVPWVYRVRVTGYQNGADGTGLGTAAVPSDFITTMKFLTCQNNWVMKNAAVKWHAARKNMWRKAGVRRRDLGTYTRNSIRYNFDEDDSASSWATPLDGDGAVFAGGTWDTDYFRTEGDQGFSLKLLGVAADEDGSQPNAAAYQIGASYLASRAQVPADSNLESTDTPAEFSALNDLLGSSLGVSTIDDNIKVDMQGQGDNPPYDEYTPGDTSHDITEPVEAGRIIMTAGATVASCVFDVPFGIFSVAAQHYDHADTNITDAVAYAVKVTDIYPMQG